jgi:hypothetical protein
MATLKLGGKEWEARGLARAHARELRKDGILSEDFGADPARTDELVDKVLSWAFPGRAAEVDELPNADAYRLFNAVIAETFRPPSDAEKNSSGPGPGSPTQAG